MQIFWYGLHKAHPKGYGSAQMHKMAAVGDLAGVGKAPRATSLPVLLFAYAIRTLRPPVWLS